MRTIAWVLIPFLLFVILLDFFFWKGILRTFKIKRTPLYAKVLYILHTVFFMASYAWFFTQVKEVHNFELYNYFAFLNALAMMVYIPKLVFIVFYVLQFIRNDMRSRYYVEGEHSKSRRQFIAKTGLVISAIPFTGVLSGMVYGRFAFRTITREVFSENLPEAFDGFKVVLTADIHLGAFKNYKGAVMDGVKMINDLRPDIFLFAGDLVNNFAEETYGWNDVFGDIEAPYGKYSVLGNHDYGKYANWEDEDARMANFFGIQIAHKEFGWRLLRNESVRIEKDNQSFHVVGVENWGLPPFPQYGDLDVALDKVPDDSFKILISHDPTHWEEKVQGKRNIDLTVSGHTHGMQMGIELGNIRWSPAKYRYTYWADLYTMGPQSLYVNRGFGTLGFSGRIGMPPEITQIILRKARS